jgi:FAD/FMN-containing dehydrogenase
MPYCAAMPDVCVAPFGHLGDGNIHFNLVEPEGKSREFTERSSELVKVVNTVVRENVKLWLIG